MKWISWYVCLILFIFLNNALVIWRSIKQTTMETHIFAPQFFKSTMYILWGWHVSNPEYSSTWTYIKENSKALCYHAFYWSVALVYPLYRYHDRLKEKSDERGIQNLWMKLKMIMDIDPLKKCRNCSLTGFWVLKSMDMSKVLSWWTAVY